LSIAKALIHEPELLFLDEPTAGLDPEAARDIIENIKKLNREKVTIFVCTHNLSEAEKFCSRFIFLDRGRIMEAGTLAEIEAKYSADVELRIEFDGVWEGPLPGSHPWRLDAPGVMTVHLPGRKAVPATVRFLSHHVDLFSVTATNSNLEALYFEIRRTHRERSDH
jgi:ABC-2 type transport system ATP-binding protein